MLSLLHMWLQEGCDRICFSFLCTWQPRIWVLPFKKILAINCLGEARGYMISERSSVACAIWESRSYWQNRWPFNEEPWRCRENISMMLWQQFVLVTPQHCITGSELFQFLAAYVSKDLESLAAWRNRVCVNLHVSKLEFLKNKMLINNV